MKYHVRMTVRKRGAIGIFYPNVFVVDGPDLEHDDEGRRIIFQLWQNQFSEFWEPDRLLGFSPIPPTHPEGRPAPAPLVNDDIGEYDTDAH